MRAIRRPDKKIIEELQKKDSRIHYFPLKDSIFIEEDNVGIKTLDDLYAESIPDKRCGLTYIQHVALNFFATRKIGDYIQSQHPFPLQTRGITISIGGELTLPDGKTIIDLLEVLSTGTELRGTDTTLTAGIEPDGQLHHRVEQHMRSGSNRLRERAKPEQRDLIFPALLAYNQGMLTPGKYLYEARLPSTDRDRVIVGAYILDYLVTKEEFLEH